MLPLLVNRSKRKGNNGKTIVSPKRSFKSVINALKRVGTLGFLTRARSSFDFKILYGFFLGVLGFFFCF